MFGWALSGKCCWRINICVLTVWGLLCWKVCMCVFTPGSSSMCLSMTEESFTLSNSGLTHVSAIPLNADSLFTVFRFLKLFSAHWQWGRLLFFCVGDSAGWKLLNNTVFTENWFWVGTVRYWLRGKKNRCSHFVVQLKLNFCWLFSLCPHGLPWPIYSLGKISLFFSSITVNSTGNVHSTGRFYSTF